MIRSMIFSSVIAGVLAALALTLVQGVWVTPLILKAEVYEKAADEVNTEEPLHSEAAEITGHHHESTEHEEAWAPADGWQRTLSTAVSNSLMGIGFALMLTGIYSLRQPQGAVQGLAWGLAGFTVFFASPGLGLPPELPGTEAASLNDRQVWWLATASCTALGLALLFLQKRWVVRVLALPLIVTPHLIGAPQPAIAHGVAPEELQQSFRIATLAVNAAFWLLLGLISAVVFQRFTREATV